jgi:hypothetical protein
MCSLYVEMTSFAEVFGKTFGSQLYSYATATTSSFCSHETAAEYTTGAVYTRCMANCMTDMHTCPDVSYCYFRCSVYFWLTSRRCNE